MKLGMLSYNITGYQKNPLSTEKWFIIFATILKYSTNWVG